MSKKQNLNIGSDSFQNEQIKIGKDSGDNSTSIDSGIYSDQLYHHSSDFGSSKYDDSNLDPFYIQNKEYLNTRAVRQDNWDKAANGITRAAAKIVPRAIEGIVNPFYGTVAALAHTDEEGNWDPSFNSFYDNSLTNGVQAASEYLDKELPLYATREAQNAKGLEKLLYANTLWGDVLDGMSYSAAAMVSGGAWSKAINLLGKSAAVGKAGEFLSGWSKIDNAADANKYVTQFENTLFNIKDGVKKGMTAFVGATTEASDNALSDSKEWYKDMEYKLTHDLSGNKVRNLTDGEKDWLEQNRKDLGNASFAMNLPVIMADNWITFGRSMFSKKSAEKALLSDVANKSIRDEATDSYKMAAKSAVDKFLSKTYGARQFVTPMVSEGLQEVEQLGVSKGTQDYYTKKYYNPEAADFLDSFGVGFSQAMSKEGLEAFMIGAISSGIFGNATKLATEGTAGYTDQTDDVTKQAINYLNANKSKPAFKAMVEAFNRHSNLAIEYDQAVEANDDFEAVNKAQDMMINHITSKIKTGKLDDFKKDLASFEKLSPEEFEGSYGIKLSNDQVTGLKQSMSSFIKPKLDAANKVEKLHNALENMFPNAPQSIKDRLLYASYSLENSADRANELSTKVQKTLQENQSRYGTNVLINNAFVPTNYFKLDLAARKEFVKNITESQEISPIDKEQILKDVADIDKLDRRRLSFIEDYKSLSNIKVQNDLVVKDAKVEEELPATVEGAEKEAKDTEEAEQLAEEGQSIDPFADAILNENINKFAERIKSGEKLTSPEDLEFYQNNKEKVKARLKELGNQLNAKDDTKLESSYPENEEEIYPRVYESNATANPLRTGALKDIVLQPKEVSELIEKLRSKGKDINDTIKLRAVDFNGKKSIQILSGDSILGFFNDEKYSKEAFKQIASQIPVGTTLDNKKVKQLGFGIKVSGGIIATSNEATTIGDLAIDKKSTGDQFVIYDQGTKTEGTFTSEPQLITLSIDPSEHKLPEYTKMFGRYVLATKDSSGNWKHIPIYPTKLKNLTGALQDKYFNDLKAELDRLKGVKEIDTDALYEFNAEVNKDVFISLSKEEVKKSGVDGIEVTLDINSKGNLRVNIVYITRTGGETKTTRKKLVIKDNAIGNNLDTLIEAINSQNPGFVLTKDSFKKSIPTGTMYKVKGDEFEAYIEPQVFKGQKVTMTVDNAAMALNTVEETKVDNLSLSNVDAKADIERRRQEELNQLEKELNDLGIVIGENNLKESAEKILEDIQSPFVKQILKALLNLISKTGTTLVIVKEGGIGYNPSKNKITIGLDTILDGFNKNKENRSKGTTNGSFSIKYGKSEGTAVSYFATTLLHEIVHTFTSKQIDIFNGKTKGELTKEETEILNNLQKIFDLVKNNPVLKGEYGLYDLHELIAEVFSNETFADKLKNISLPKELQYKAKSKNLFEGIIDLISDLITKAIKGFTKQSINNEETAFQNISNLVNDLINAKYDAELAAKKADIERRRQEDLDRETPVKNENITVDFGGGLFVKYQVITYKNGSVKISTTSEKSKRYNELSDEVFRDYAKIDFESDAKGIIKTELVKNDYTDKQSQEVQVAKEKTINAKYDAEYVDAVKKGEITKEQAMQALEEIGRKDSSAYAELAALGGTKSKSKSIIQQAKDNAKKDPKGPELGNTLFKTGEEVVDNLITNKEIDDLKNIIPQGIEVQTKKDLTTFFDNVIKDKTVWGYFKDKVIYLSTGAGLGTGYHEAFHAIFRYGMNNEEVRRYLALAAKDLNSKYTKSQIESKLADLRAIYGDVSNINELLLEEHLADEFMKYKNNKPVQVGLKSLFRRFINMLKALVGISNQLDSLFGQIERGNFAARVATKNDISSDLVFKNVPSGETSFLTQSKSKKLINTYATRVAKISKSWDGKSKKLSNEQILDSLLSERKDVLETLAVDYIENVTDNIKKERLKKSLKDEYYSLQNPIGNQILKNEVLKKLDLFNITEEENEQDGSDNTTERFGNKDAWMLSMEETLPKQIRQYIAFATYKTIDELTGEEVDMSVDAETIYNGLSHVLANTAEDDILNKWIAYAKDNDQAKAVLDMVMSDTGMSYDDNGAITDPTKNFNDLRKIITAFKRVKVQFQHTEFNPIYDFTSKSLTSNKVDTYNANRNTPEKIQMNNWANNLQNISSKERPSKEEWSTRAKEAVASFTKNINNEITNDVIKDIKTKVSKLGINLSNGFIRYSLIALKEKVGNASEEELEYNSNFDVEPLDIDIFTSTEYGLSKLLSEGKDVFGKVEGIRGRLETIAKANSMFDESIATSNFKGADGNTRYDIILPSYALNESLKLKSKGYRESLIEKYPILKNNIFINNDKVMNDFSIGVISGLRDHTKTDNEGKVFGDYSEREYLSQYLGYWFGQKNKKAQFLFRQNEASNTAYVTELPVMEYYTDKITDKAIDTVFEFFKSEYNRIGIETANGLGNIKGYNDTDKGRAFRFTEFSNLLYSMTPTEYNQLTADAKNGNELTDDQIGRIKYILKTNLAKGMSDFKNLLEENKFGKFKGGILSSNFLIPTNFGSDNSEITHQLNNLYLNDYINSFGVNQLLDGDYALSRDDKGGVEVEIDGVKVIVPKQPIQIDITKRNKGAMGSGPDMGKGTHRVAYTKDINAYVEDEPVNGNLVRVPDDSKIYKDSDGSSYILKGDVKVKVSKVNSSDAQSYNTINHVIFMAERLGRLDETVKTILRKVRRGIPINGGEQKTLQNAQVSLNPWKTVTFGREFYIKTSEALLDRHEVSIVTNQDRFNELMDELESLEDSNTLDIDKLITINKQLVELYQPIPGKEYYHDILNQMDIHGIDQVVAESASKGATLSPVNTMEKGFDLSKSMQDIPNEYKRLQVETPTGKTEITSGTQLMQLIDSEQNDEIKIGKTSVGELRKKYRELMASSRSNSFRLAEQLIREKDGNIDITRLSDKFLKSLEASGADDQLLEIFGMNWNLLPAIDKAEQLFLAHFGNGVLSQKVPGTKVALMSDAHFRLVVDENDKPVLNKTVKSDPSKYKQSKTRKLLHNVKDPITGEIYSECVLSERVFSKFGLKIGDSIPIELATMLGYRIPTQDKHSMISLRVVDVLPIHLEGTGIFPQEIVYLSGADFDIDSLFIQQPSFWMNDGVPTKYGTEKTIEDKWTAYLNYILANKDIQLSISKKRQFGPDLTKEEFDELTPEAKEFLYDTYNRQTLKEFGLPSTMKEYEKYLKSGKKIINNEINNDILDIELKLLTNSHMLEKIAYTPVSSDPLVKVAKKIMDLKGLSDSDKNSVHDILGKFKAFSQNSAGKSGIGIVANALQAFTFLARNKTKRDGTLIKINGKEFNSFEYINSIGNRVADLLSTILSVMTDNAKDPIAGKMGLSLELLPTYTYLVSLGVSEESAALLINIPIIQKYSNLKKENKFGIKSSYEKGMTNDGKIIKLLVDELGIEKTKADTYSIFKLKDASSNIEFDDLTNEGLIKDGITKDNTEVQLQLLGKFLKIEEEAESFRDLNNVIKLTKGLATNFNDLDKNLVESLYRLGIDGLFKTPYKEIDKTAPFNITNAVKEDSLLFSNIVMALNSIKKADGIFITESPLFKVQFEKLLNNLKDKLSKDTLADAKRSFLGFLTTKAYNKLLTDNRTAAGMKNAKVTMNDELLFPELGGKTLAAELIELKNSKNENISENTFIKWLAPSLKSNNPKQVIDLVSGKSFIKLSKDTINDILDGYKELFNNAETNEFAIKAFNYLLVKDNLEYKNDSFVKYIAPYMFNTVSDSLNLAVSQLAKKEDIEKVFGADMISLGDEFREIYSAYKPNQYKSVVVKKGDKMGMKTFADSNNKAMLVSDNGSTITFNTEADATADPDRKSENMSYLTGIFDSKKDKDSKQVTFKFPEFMVIKVGKEERLYKTDVSGMVKWDTYAEYKQVEQFGYPNVSPYPKSLKDSRATQAKLGSLIRTNEEEEYSEDGELTNPMDVFSTSTKDKVVGVEEVFGNILSSSDSDAFDNGPDNFDLVFGEINTGNKLQESEKNSILGKDFGVVKAELNRKIISSNFSDSQMKEYLTDLNNSKTIEDLEKLIQKIC